MLARPVRPFRRTRAVAALAACSLAAAPLASVRAGAQERQRPDDAALWAGAGALLVGSALLDRTLWRAACRMAEGRAWSGFPTG